MHYWKEEVKKYIILIPLYNDWKSVSKLLVEIDLIVNNFDAEVSHQFELRIPQDIISQWGLSENTYELEDLLYQQNNKLILRNGEGFINVSLAPLESFIFKL